MGLDTVELILRAEEEFQIEIGDEEASLVSTCGQFCALIENKLIGATVSGSGVCVSSAAFYRVRRELVGLSGVSRREIGPKTRLADVLQKPTRNENWSRLESSLKCSLPPLKRPDFWFAVGAIPAFCLWILGLPPLSDPFFSSRALGISLWLGAGLWIWFVAFLSRPFAVVMPRELQTVADLAWLVVGRQPVETTQDLWPRVQRLIADELGVPLERITREAEFVRDLGAD